MELLNATAMQAGYTLGMDPDGRERIVVVVKGTFTIPKTQDELELAETQMPLVMADQHTGDPGLSATFYESDFAPFKPRCDVLLNGTAYAPGGNPVQSVEVSVRVGRLKKSFNVVGNRRWQKSLFSVKAGFAEPFTRMAISYDCAYGGVDADAEQPENKKAYSENPVGIGYLPLTRRDALVGKRLPNTEEVGRPISTPADSYRPMSFGPVGRQFQSRLRYAGTYDQAWLDNVFPFLPVDFDPRYYQAAPDDQQIDYPHGGEDVDLVNLTPEGRVRFFLPTIEVPVEFTHASYERSVSSAVLDTVVMEPDIRRVMIVWRSSIALRRNVFEITRAVVGRMPRGWYRARETGKTYHASLRDLVAARSAGIMG
jgi:hypothetical protein